MLDVKKRAVATGRATTALKLKQQFDTKVENDLFSCIFTQKGQTAQKESYIQ